MSSLADVTGGQWPDRRDFGSPAGFWHPGVLVAIVPPAARNRNGRGGHGGGRRRPGWAPRPGVRAPL